MRYAGFALAIVVLVLSTGCQQASQRCATWASVERIGEEKEQYRITVRLEQLDARGNVLETIAQPQIVCLADQPAQVAIGQVAADGSRDGVTVDVLVPSDAVPPVVKLTTTVQREHRVVSKEDLEIPIPVDEPR